MREGVKGLLATLKLTVPEPVPLEPDVILIQDALLTAVQEQMGVVTTLALNDPPAELTVPGAVDVTVYVHAGGVTVIVTDLVIVPPGPVAVKL